MSAQVGQTGKSLASAALFRDSPGNVATKVQVSSTVRQAASLLGMETLTGAHRHSVHTFRATGAMYLASCGIDVWRIQLHGRWGSRAVLMCVRLAVGSVSIAGSSTGWRPSRSEDANIGSQSRFYSIAGSILAS